MEVDSTTVHTSTPPTSNIIEDHTPSKRKTEEEEEKTSPSTSSSVNATTNNNNTENDDTRSNITDPLANMNNGGSIATLSSLALLPPGFPTISNLWASMLGTMNPPPDETVVKMLLNNSNLMAPPFGSNPSWSTTPKGKTPSATTATYPKKPSQSTSKKDTSNNSTTAAGASDRGSKGLKHFSLKVCEKVQNKGTTTYNDVANELVNDYVAGELSLGDETTGSKKKKNGGEEKNIRRRVYDALNVLMALKIITKEKKEIKWKGFPVNYHQEYDQLMVQKKQRLDSIQEKTAQLEELKKQRNASRNLFERNKEVENDENSQVMLPFIIVHTGKETIIECEMDEEGTDLFFNFSLPFEIHDDNEILYRLDLDKPSPAQVMEDELLLTQLAQLIQQQTPSHDSSAASSSNQQNTFEDEEEDEEEDKEILSEEEEEEPVERKPSKSKKSSAKASSTATNTASSSKKKRGRKSKAELARSREQQSHSASESGAESSSQPSKKKTKKNGDTVIELSDEE